MECSSVVKDISVPSSALRFAAPVALKQGEQDAASRRFEGVAYSGKEITGHPFWGKVIFDLSTTVANTSLPILLGHDREKIVGFTDQVEIAESIRISGKVTNTTPYGVEVAKLSDEGFPWQMSVHIDPERVEKLSKNKTTFVNGQKVIGPANIFRNSKIREVSFTPTGMDDRTHAYVMSGELEEGGEAKDIPVIENNNPEGEEQMSDESNERIKTLEETNMSLKAELEETNEELIKEKADKAELLKSHRFERLKVVFENLGKELKESDCEVYFSMKDEFFDRVVQDLEAVKPSIPENLFSEEAKDGEEDDDNKIINEMSSMQGNLNNGS
jgi:hypothetical protein